jgi:Cu-processing system permease protein
VREASIISRKELRDAVQGRWLIVFSAAFALLALTLALVDSQTGSAGAQGFNRTTAGLINLCLLIVPLLALILGAGAIAGERERGTLVGLLSQPLSATELLLGKFAGLLVAIWMAIALGFGAAALLVAAFNPLTDAGYYLLFMALSAVLAAAMLAVGMLISVVARSRVKALAIAVSAWFVFVLFYDLGAIAFALAVSSSGKTLLLTVLVNPVEAVRILAILRLEPDPQILGPLGSYMSNEFGKTASAGLLAGSVVAWIAVPLALAARLFARQDA